MKVTSSHISNIVYDRTTRTMRIGFKGGSLYEYRQVPEQFYKTLTEADSHGEFFHKNFKPHFDGKRIN